VAEKTKKPRRAVKVELKPNKQQQAVLRSWTSACRGAWNILYRANRWAYISKENGIDTGWDLPKDGYKYFNALAKHAPWLQDVPSSIRNQVIQNYRKALRNCAKNRAHFGLPQKKRRGSRESLTYQSRGLFVTDTHVRVPKLGKVKVKECPTVRTGGQAPKMITISRDVDRWYASFSLEFEPALSLPHKECVGVDLNTHSVVTTDEVFEIPAALKRAEIGIKQAQRELARKRVGGRTPSKRYIATRVKLGKRYRRCRRLRADWLHKITTHLVQTYGTIVIEDLKVRNMTKSAKGTEEEPGKNVRQKAGLNRSILNASFSELRRQLEYKCAWYGRDLIAVNPAYTSRTCHACGHINEKPLRVYRQFVCESCGHEDDRDHNAALNIKLRGLRASEIPGGTGVMRGAKGDDKETPPHGAANTKPIQTDDPRQGAECTQARA